MANESGASFRFRKHMRAERERRKWSQSMLAKALQDKGLDHMLTSMVAKIETGSRSVRIDEAQAIAELFGMSVDAILGRDTLNDNQLATELRLARTALTKAQLALQETRVSLAATAAALRTAPGRRPDGDAETLMNACNEAATGLDVIDRQLGAALAEAGGLAR